MQQKILSTFQNCLPYRIIVKFFFILIYYEFKKQIGTVTVANIIL